VGEIDSVDDFLIDNVARFLLKDWEGVGQLVDGGEVAIDYTPEIGIVMLKQHLNCTGGYWPRLQILLRVKSSRLRKP
jgi:hypothetical protein